MLKVCGCSQLEVIPEVSGRSKEGRSVTGRERHWTSLVGTTTTEQRSSPSSSMISRTNTGARSLFKSQEVEIQGWT